MSDRDAAAKALEYFMSELSERISNATWDRANEEVIWGFAENPDEEPSGLDCVWPEITLEDRQRVAMLREACGCWCIWDPNERRIRRVPVDEYRDRLRSGTTYASWLRSLQREQPSHPSRIGSP